jgi:hypothetical protein
MSTARKPKSRCVPQVQVFSYYSDWFTLSFVGHIYSSQVDQVGQVLHLEEAPMSHHGE